MYDVIIIGAGPAGISASLYTQRANLKTLIIYKKTEISALEKANEVSNYYGFEKGIKGKELYGKGIKQAVNLGVEILEEEVTNIKQEGNQFKVETLKNKFDSKTVILATGNKRNKPNIKGIELFEGKGISYCAICDGFFFKNKNVAIIGNGDYAISETMDLQNIVKSITILTNGQEMPEYRAENVDIVKKEIDEVIGEKRVEKIKFKDNSIIKVDGIFVAQGVAGSTEFARKVGAKIQNDKIVVNDAMETNIKGLYACGDCTGGLYQISKAVYEGTKAGLQVINYLMSF
ncbi:MAG: NAD(P)/FAD-dependent oxidoreductase [Clostridia bacterium]|nr:NAD(P)/FAD-dependent oxidoreductase [Clostridia bacterium]